MALEGSTLFIWPDGSEFKDDKMAGEMKNVATVLGATLRRFRVTPAGTGCVAVVLLRPTKVPNRILRGLGEGFKDSLPFR